MSLLNLSKLLLSQISIFEHSVLIKNSLLFAILSNGFSKDSLAISFAFIARFFKPFSLVLLVETRADLLLLITLKEIEMLSDISENSTLPFFASTFDTIEFSMTTSESIAPNFFSLYLQHQFY